MVAGRIYSSRRNAEILLELKSSCCSCSIPLTVDGRRMDALQNVPTHGLSAASYPFFYEFLTQEELPQFWLPRATLHSSAGAGYLKDMLQLRLEAPPRLAVVAVLVAHVRKSPLARHYRPYAEKSVRYWVLDGVIIDQEVLPLPVDCCSLAVFASAEGLTTDLSGMKLVQDHTYHERTLALNQSVEAWLTKSEANFERLLQGVESRARQEGALVFLAGAGLSFLAASPVILIPSALFGGVFYGQYKGSTDKPRVAEAVKTAFAKLRQAWPRSGKKRRSRRKRLFLAPPQPGGQ